MIDPLHADYSDTPISPGRPALGYVPSRAGAKPCATIMTPFFNTGAIFHETARSVFQQSLQEWEWVIVNDGSTDPESLSILDGYRHRDPRIRVVDHQENRGLSAARNTGFRAANTPYVLQLDSDDLLEPRVAEMWFWCLESQPQFGFVTGYTVNFGAREYLWEAGFHDGELFLEENRVDANTMVRRSVHADAGGYDESNRGGLEDREFWLRCADRGHWGTTVHEYGDWYRRRPVERGRWANWDDGPRQAAFGEALQRRYGRLWEGGFPHVEPRQHVRHDRVRDWLPCENRLRKDAPRVVLVLPSISGDAGESQLRLLELFRGQGWGVTVVSAAPGEVSTLVRFARQTPDLFVLPHFLPLGDYPRFIRYLIGSRDADAVVISASEFGYALLPYLRAHHPELPLVDHWPPTPGPWSLLGERYGGMLDLHLVGAGSCGGPAAPIGERVRMGAGQADGTGRSPAGTQTGADRCVVASDVLDVAKEVRELAHVRRDPPPSLGLGLIAASQAIESQRLLEMSSDAAAWRAQVETRHQELESRMVESESRSEELRARFEQLDSHMLRIYESLPARLYRGAKSLPAARRLGMRLRR